MKKKVVAIYLYQNGMELQEQKNNHAGGVRHGYFSGGFLNATHDFFL